MRKNFNVVKIEGYVYDSSKLSIRESGPTSKKPGTIFIMGDLDVATDEQGLNVIPVHFTYVTEFFAKSGKVNNTYTVLKKIIEAPEKTWLANGKDNAIKVKIDAAIAINDFIGQDEQPVAAKRVEGSFVNIVTALGEEEERNTFSTDMVITRVNHIDADPDRNIEKDYVTVGGAVFNFRNDLLPVEFIVRNAGGMEYFENLDITNSEPVYTKVWGRIKNQTIKVEKEEESAFGEAAVTTYERKSREWLITGTAKVPYDFGDEEVMTVADLTEAMQNREVLLAEVKKRNDEYQASKKANNTTAAPTPVKAGGFTF